MKKLADRIMSSRARNLVARIGRHLPSSGTIADIGSGTGHNAVAIRYSTSLAAEEFDIADLHWVGPGPVIFEAGSLPRADKSFDAIVIMFVLQYAEYPLELLREVRRVARGRVIILQSTYRGWLGQFVLRIREFLWGRAAFRLASLWHTLPPTPCPLEPRQYYTRLELQQLFTSAGFTLLTMEQANWIGLGVSRDLFVLEPIEHD